MNMSTQASTTATQTLSRFTGERYTQDTHPIDRSIHVKEYLDANFPLTNGSHQDVTSYVVYYTHLLAFLKDGTQCGLLKPCQFVALTGHKSEPLSILLKNDDTHVEICFDRQGQLGCKDLAHIEDVQVEMPIKNMPTPYKQWLSLLHGNQSPNQGRNKSFTAKDGSEYQMFKR